MLQELQMHDRADLTQTADIEGRGEKAAILESGTINLALNGRVGWKGDPLKGCNVFLRRQEPSRPVRTGLLPAQEHDSVCGKGWISACPVSAPRL